MKKLIAPILAATLLFSAAPADAAWLVSGVVTNPAANQVVVDSGGFPIDSARGFCVFAASTVGVVLRFQYVDVNGTSVLREQIIAVAANASNSFCPPSGRMEVDTLAGQRFRVIVNAAVTGSLSVSLHSD